VPSRAERDLCRPFLEEQIRLVNPDVVIPVGRVAVNALLSGVGRFEDLIGTVRRVDGRWIVPLPHPSGASRWHQLEANRTRIDRAIRHLARLRRRLGL
jgi:uracil-DNA glycosylase